MSDFQSDFVGTSVYYRKSAKDAWHKADIRGVVATSYANNLSFYITVKDGPLAGSCLRVQSNSKNISFDPAGFAVRVDKGNAKSLDLIGLIRDHTACPRTVYVAGHLPHIFYRMHDKGKDDASALRFTREQADAFVEALTKAGAEAHVFDENAV